MSSQERWDEYVKFAKDYLRTGDLDNDEIDDKLKIGGDTDAARRAVIGGDDNWTELLKKALEVDRPISGYDLPQFLEWCNRNSQKAAEALRAIWTTDLEPEDSSIPERIREFYKVFPSNVLKVGIGKRTTLASALLMGLKVEDYPPFNTDLFEGAYTFTGYDQPKTNADEASIYEHALSFLDRFLIEAEKRQISWPHRNRLAAQSVARQIQSRVRKNSRRPDESGDITPNIDNGETKEDADGWEEFVRRANELISSGNLVKWEIAYKLVIGGKVAAAREAVLFGSDDWADWTKKSIAGNLINGINQARVREWINDSPSDAFAALEAIWETCNLSVSQRVAAFCSLFPSEVLSGTGVRTNVASVLLMAIDVEQYPPFLITKFENAYKRTGYCKPEPNSNEAELYEHALGFLDHLIRESRAHGVHLRHRLDAQSAVWWLTDNLPVLGKPPPKCSLEALADELLWDVSLLEEIKTLIYDKRQVIFQGPPGTGKTFVAQKLANCLARYQDRVTLVQFHPSYAYEDFVRGFRPTLKDAQAGFALQDGPLLRAAQKAREERDAEHFLIIDEINRGNLAKVFGELYFLLEYRDKKIRMQYQLDDEDDFSLPENLYIIGTMNTADRSTALVDLALRRRFYFIEFHPDKEPIKSVLRKWLSKNAPDLDWVAEMVEISNEQLNEQLEDDRHAAIGPSYFMKDGLEERMVKRIWEHSVLPYLEERLFGEEDKINVFEYTKLSEKAKQNVKERRLKEQTGNDAEVQEEPEQR